LWRRQNAGLGPVVVSNWRRRKTTTYRRSVPTPDRSPDLPPARIELRLKPADRDILQKAAALVGDDVASFVRRTAMLKARRLLAEFDDPAPRRRRAV